MTNPYYESEMFAHDIDEAVRALLPFRLPIVNDADAISGKYGSTIPSKQISLVGCKERDIGDLSDRLTKSRFRLTDSVSGGDPVLFCISCADGPTAGTKASVANCRGKSILPIAIVLTNYDLIDDESLRELVTLEERELLSSILPEEIVDQIPLMYDFDPSLVFRLNKLMSSNMKQIQCHT